MGWNLQWEEKSFFFANPLALLPRAYVTLKTATRQSPGSAVFLGESVVLILVHSRSNTFSDSSNRPCVIVNITLYGFCHDCAMSPGSKLRQREVGNLPMVSGGTYHNCGPAECYTNSHKYASHGAWAIHSQVLLPTVGVPMPESMPLQRPQRRCKQEHPCLCCKARQG